MSSEDRLRIAFREAMDGAAPGLASADRLCRACVDLLDVDGAAISLIHGGTTHGTFGSSGELGRRLDEYQFTFGEGPCLDAVTRNAPILVADFEAADEMRWPAFAGAMAGAGIRAVYALPVQISTTGVGALDLYRTRPGELASPALTGALLAAQLAALPLLDLMSAQIDWAGIAAGDPWSQLQSLERVEVYQATGMVMRQIDAGPTAALARIRAHAFTHGQTATEVAWAIVERRLRMEPDLPPELDVQHPNDKRGPA